ncbi:MAG: hypothetical protein ABI316_04240 [Casimicrobiaceae bacterium]
MHADARQPLVFRKQAIVRRVVEVEDVAKMPVIIGDPDEHAVADVAVLRRNQPVRVASS